MIYGIIALIMAYYAQSKCRGVLAFLSEFFIGACIMWAILLDISGLVFVAIGGLALRKHKKNLTKKSFVTPIAACLGIMLGEKAFTIAQTFLYGMTYQEAGSFLSYPYLLSDFKLPDIERIQTFVFSLGTRPIFIVSIVAIIIYWLLQEKGAFTWIMFGTVLLLGGQFFCLDTYMSHDFFIYMSLVVMFGLSVQRYLQFAGGRLADKEEPTVSMDLSEISKEKTLEKEEPVVTIVCFEEEPAVTVPPKPAEEPLIFIPKSMQIPKRVSKPKVDFGIEVSEDKLHFDYQVEENADFDI